MKFSEKTKEEARFRQWGLCAVCGEDLADMWEEAHHVHPNHLGGADKSENCVILCDNCSC